MSNIWLPLTYGKYAAFFLVRIRAGDHVEYVMIEIIEKLYELILRHLAQFRFDEQKQILGRLILNIAIFRF